MNFHKLGSVTACLMLLTQTALADGLKVTDPSVDSKSVAVPVENFTCTSGPFGTAVLQVGLPSGIGGPNQPGVLKSKFMGNLGEAECSGIIANLRKLDDGTGKIPIRIDIISRTVVRLTTSNAYTCEGAYQEIVTAVLGDQRVNESSYQSIDPLPCPDGVYPNYVHSIDQVLYVLHENGIPSTPDL